MWNAVVDAGAISPEPCGLSSLRGFLMPVRENEGESWQDWGGLGVRVVREIKITSSQSTPASQ